MEENLKYSPKCSELGYVLQLPLSWNLNEVLSYKCVWVNITGEKVENSLP